MARVPGAVTSIPGGFRKKSALRRLVDRIKLPFSKFSSLPPGRRRSLLIGSVIAGVVSFLVGLVFITGLELGVGKSLSCWIWDECPKVSFADDSKASSTSTLPSIFGGGQSTSRGITTPQVGPSNSQPQPAPGIPESPSQTPGASGTQESPGPVAPGQRWSPSGNPSDYYSEEQQQGDQQLSPSGGSENELRSSSGGSGSNQREDPGSVSPVRNSENLR